MNIDLSPRDRAYLDILHHGLVMLRDSARAGYSELCWIETEHLHEIPKLIGTFGELRHGFYLRGTRELYLQQLRTSNQTAYLKQVAIWLSQPWRILEEIADAAPAAV